MVFLYVPLNCLTPPLLLKVTVNLWVVVDFRLDCFPPLREAARGNRKHRFMLSVLRIHGALDCLGKKKSCGSLSPVTVL